MSLVLPASILALTNRFDSISCVINSLLVTLYLYSTVPVPVPVVLFSTTLTRSRRANYAFGGRSELQFEDAHVQEEAAAEEGARAPALAGPAQRHALKTRMKRVLVNAESRSFAFELAKPVRLAVRCVRAPSRGLLPAGCSRAAHWRWFHQLPADDSWANCEARAAALSLL